MSYSDFEIPDGITPLVGYRGWMVKGDSLFSCHRDVEWMVGESLVSECLRPQQRGRDDRDNILTLPPKHYWSPHIDCTCGIYALNDYPKLWENREGKRRATTKPWPHEAITGLIHGWGRIIVGTKGFRAEYAKPIALVARPRSNKWPQVIESIAERYGLEIIDAREAK